MKIVKSKKKTMGKTAGSDKKAPVKSTGRKTAKSPKATPQIPSRNAGPSTPGKGAVSKSPPAKSGNPAVGQPAPSFTMMSSDGKLVSLSDFRGKRVVLYFYPKDDTPGCTKEACAFRDGIDEIQESGAVVLGVSPDSVESHKKFIQKYNLNFPLLSDGDKKVAQAYGVWKEKSLYGRKYMGIERTTFIIDEQGTIDEIFSKVKVDGHLEEVLGELDLING